VIEIEVHGFQSIAKASLKVDGFTALVGRSNIGKSAFVRAVRCALTNPVGTSFVRHRRDCARQASKKKTCDCKSTVHIRAENFDLTWEKGDKINRYQFNGQEYDKPERGTPDFLASTGFAPVKVGDKPSFLQVADQFFPIFLLDLSGNTIAETISDVSKLDCINSATKLVEKERREIASTRKVREADIQVLDSRISSFEGLTEDLKLVKKAEDTLAQIEALAGKRDALARFLGCLSDIKQSLQALEVCSKISVPDESELMTQSPRVAQMNRFLENLHQREQSVAQLSKVTEVQVDFDDAALRDRSSIVNRFLGWFGQLKAVKSKLEAFEGLVVEISEPSSLSIPLTKSLQEKTYSARITPLHSDISALEKSLVALEAEEQTVKESLGSIEFCPTCERPVREGHAHAETVLSV